MAYLKRGPRALFRGYGNVRYSRLIDRCRMGKSYRVVLLSPLVCYRLNIDLVARFLDSKFRDVGI